MRASRRAAALFPLAALCRFCGEWGPGQGVSGARRDLRHERAVQEGEEGRGARELLEKWRGTRASLYLAKGPGLADEAGGEGGHGAAKPDGVIHRYISNWRCLLLDAP
jgi:hypothetical protein